MPTHRMLAKKVPAFRMAQKINEVYLEFLVYINRYRKFCFKNQGHHYCAPKALDSTNFENGYLTVKVSFQSHLAKTESMTAVLCAFRTQIQTATLLLLWKWARTQSTVELDTERKQDFWHWKRILSDQMSCSSRKWILGWLAPGEILY